MVARLGAETAKQLDEARAWWVAEERLSRVIRSMGPDADDALALDASFARWDRCEAIFGVQIADQLRLEAESAGGISGRVGEEPTELPKAVGPAVDADPARADVAAKANGAEAATTLDKPTAAAGTNPTAAPAGPAPPSTAPPPKNESKTPTEVRPSAGSRPLEVVVPAENPRLNRSPVDERTPTPESATGQPSPLIAKDAATRSADKPAPALLPRTDAVGSVESPATMPSASPIDPAPPVESTGTQPPVPVDRPPTVDESSPVDRPPTLDESSPDGTPPTVDKPNPVATPPGLDEPSSVDRPPTVEKPSSVDGPPTVEKPSSVDTPPTVDESSPVATPPTLEEPPTLDQSPTSTTPAATGPAAASTPPQKPVSDGFLTVTKDRVPGSIVPEGFVSKKKPVEEKAAPAKLPVGDRRPGSSRTKIDKPRRQVSRLGRRGTAYMAIGLLLIGVGLTGGLLALQGRSADTTPAATVVPTITTCGTTRAGASLVNPYDRPATFDVHIEFSDATSQLFPATVRVTVAEGATADIDVPIGGIVLDPASLRCTAAVVNADLG